MIVTIKVTVFLLIIFVAFLLGFIIGVLRRSKVKENGNEKNKN